MVTHDNYLAGFADVILRIKDGKIIEIEDHRGEQMPDAIKAQEQKRRQDKGKGEKDADQNVEQD